MSDLVSWLGNLSLLLAFPAHFSPPSTPELMDSPLASKRLPYPARNFAAVQVSQVAAESLKVCNMFFASCFIQCINVVKMGNVY
eukprot:1161772-Pelagomonas_calceolata.AAC.12